RLAVAMRRRLALIDETLLQATRQTFGRTVGVVEVVAGRFAGQQHVQDVVAVVVPLGLEAAPEMRGGIVVVFQDEMNWAAGRGGGALFGRPPAEPVRFGYGVNRIEPQSIEPIFDKPIERILNKEAPHLVAAKIDRGSPRRRHLGAERLWRVERQIIAVRT